MRLLLRIGLAVVVFIIYRAFKQPQDPRVPEFVRRFDLEKRQRKTD